MFMDIDHADTLSLLVTVHETATGLVHVRKGRFANYFLASIASRSLLQLTCISFVRIIHVRAIDHAEALALLVHATAFSFTSFSPSSSPSFFSRESHFLKKNLIDRLTIRDKY